MTRRAYIDAPVPIMRVLDAALKAVSGDSRFRAVPNGRIEVAWRQPSKGRDGEGDRPARYAISFECGFRELTTDDSPQESSPRSASPGSAPLSAQAAPS